MKKPSVCLELQCILPREINGKLQDDKDDKHLHQSDEYYAMLDSTSMKDLILNKLVGIFTIEWHHKTVFAPDSS